jgi:hypothetical protein
MGSRQSDKGPLTVNTAPLSQCAALKEADFPKNDKFDVEKR